MDTVEVKETAEDYLKPGEENKAPEFQAWLVEEIEAAQLEAKKTDDLVPHREVKKILGLEY